MVILLYIIQFVVVICLFFQQDSEEEAKAKARNIYQDPFVPFKSKRDFLLHLIPYYWVVWGIKLAVKGIANQWHKLG